MGDFDDRADFTDADRGLIGSLEPCVVHGPKGNVVWDNDAYGFLEADCPETANPHPTDADIDTLENVCRCGTYVRIRKAIHRAAG